MDGPDLVTCERESVMDNGTGNTFLAYNITFCARVRTWMEKSLDVDFRGTVVIIRRALDQR